MLLANKRVAEKMKKGKERFVYRVHDQPDEEKLKNLQTVVKRLGYNLELNKNSLNDSLNTLLENTFGKNEQNLIDCLLYTSPSPRDRQKSRMPSSA